MSDFLDRETIPFTPANNMQDAQDDAYADRLDMGTIPFTPANNMQDAQDDAYADELEGKDINDDFPQLSPAEVQALHARVAKRLAANG